jgi:methionine salvage enolase-phosphatase E1
LSGILNAEDIIDANQDDLGILLSGKIDIDIGACRKSSIFLRITCDALNSANWLVITGSSERREVAACFRMLDFAHFGLTSVSIERQKLQEGDELK